jgi:hypothetical protein
VLPQLHDQLDLPHLAQRADVLQRGAAHVLRVDELLRRGEGSLEVRLDEGFSEDLEKRKRVLRAGLRCVSVKQLGA